MTQIEDKSLIRCTVKKSVSVFQKIVLCVAYVVVALIAIAISFFDATVILPPLVSNISGVGLQVVSALTSVPWYYYAGIIAIGAIPGYSLLWCISRELTDDDWESESAVTFATFITAIVFIAAIGFIVFITIINAFIAAVAFIVIILAHTVYEHDKITVWYYIVRFPGAMWHHYRRRDTP